MYRVPIVTIFLFSSFCACGEFRATTSTRVDGSVNEPTESLTRVETAKPLVLVNGETFTVTLPDDPSIQTQMLDYEGNRQLLVAIQDASSNKESNIWMALKPCNLKRENVDAFQDSLNAFTHSFLDEGQTNGGFKLLVNNIDYAIQRVSMTAKPQSLFGYSFDYVRTYHRERMERIAILADFEQQRDICARIKVFVPEHKPITPTSLTGKTLVAIQKSFQFK